MQLSMWTAFYKKSSPEEAIEKLLSNGYTACELSSEHGEMLLSRGEPVEIGAEFGKFCRERGMSLPQGHLALSARLCDPSTPTAEILKRWLDLFAAIGIRAAVLHVDELTGSPHLSIEQRLEQNAEKLCELCQYIRGRDIVICLENLHLLCNCADQLIWLMHRINSKNIGICLDTGHLNVTERDQVGFVRKTSPYLAALHIHDNPGDWDRHLLPGKGNIDFPALVSALREIGYDGIFNYEIPGETRGTSDEQKAEILAEARKIYDSLMAETGINKGGEK